MKTRLAGDLGGDLAAKLYASFVDDLLDTFRHGDYILRIAFSPVEARHAVRDWLGDGTSLTEQRGDDLGERMKDLFFRLFREGMERVVLIGSDCPDLPAHLIAEAFDRLGGKDAVIGPARDGGYYLIGFRKDGFLPEAFDGPEWGADTVCRDTMAILSAGKSTVHVLPSWNDIDALDDLRDLYRRNRNSPFHRSATMACIERHREKIF